MAVSIPMRIVFVVLIYCASFLSPSSLAAQSSPPDLSVFPTGISVGFHLGQIQDDFHIGGSITSPTFLHDRAAIRVRGALAFLDQYDPNTNTEWSPYGWGSVSIVGFNGEIVEKIRLYGEGGLTVIFPSDAFSTTSTEFGGFGLFGFEFFLWQGFSYAIEIGGTGSGARADKIVGSPLYSNGFTIMSSFRATF